MSYPRESDKVANCLRVTPPVREARFLTSMLLAPEAQNEA